MELTKEYFDQKFNNLELKFDEKLEAQTKDLKEFSISQTEELARMVSGGFEHVDERFNEFNKHFMRIDNQLETINDKLDEHGRKFDKLEDALHIRL
jgi:predicted nuclease with TOPRIM domain